MKRNYLYPYYIFQLVLLFGFVANGCKQSKAPEKPNFIIVLVDDLGSQDVGCYGQKYIQTPNIDKLAEQGMRWTNAYSSCPVCSPTRAALLTGKNTARVHFTGHITAIGRHRYPETGQIIPPEDLMYLPHEEILIPEILKPLGYKSISIGKWHVGHEGYYPTDQGFDINIAGWTHGSPPSHFYPYTSEKDWNPSIPTLSGGHEGEYLTDRLTNEAINFIDNNKHNPFLVYLSHYAVHTPLEAPDHLVEKYKAILPGIKIDPVYAAMVESLDNNLGKIMHYLEESGLDKNTVILFASDNGAVERTSDNSPYRKGKGHLYEGGIRVPFIMRWPGVIPENAVCNNKTISHDIFTTIADIARILDQQDQTLDGRSLVPDFNEEIIDQDLFWYYPHYSPQAKNPAAAILSENYKLIRFYDPQRTELYDLSKDPGEQTDLAKKLPNLVMELNSKLDDWLLKSGTIMHTNNNSNHN